MTHYTCTYELNHILLQNQKQTTRSRVMLERKVNVLVTEEESIRGCD